MTTTPKSIGDDSLAGKQVILFWEKAKLRSLEGKWFSLLANPPPKRGGAGGGTNFTENEGKSVVNFLEILLGKTAQFSLFRREMILCY